jgi:hypothetical protein
MGKHKKPGKAVRSDSAEVVEAMAKLANAISPLALLRLAAGKSVAVADLQPKDDVVTKVPIK